MTKKVIFLCLWMTGTLQVNFAQTASSAAAPRFRVLALYENGGHHLLFSQRARIWLDQLAADSNFSVRYFTDTRSFTDSLLAQFQVFLQMDYVPYGWSDTAMRAFEKYMSDPAHGWLGFHHASLLGDFDGFPMWQWFSSFMGGIKWKDYIAGFAQATVRVEDTAHSAMKGIPASFTIQKDEWYTYDKSPRPKVHVIASVDESSYRPPSAIRMGDHPVIWSNEQYAARNMYVFMGHSPDLFDNSSYTTIFRNAIFWAAHQR
jgi:uncharacterized protein